MKMDFKNFLKNYGRIRENFRGFFGRLFVKRVECMNGIVVNVVELSG